ncbi:hypothetical protein MBLNU457_1819t1 [Dothideomycetes sp. NU457]
MSSDHCRLLDLTPEVLVLIASYCDGWSLLRLIETCRTIRSLCDDVVVWQTALKNRLDRVHEEFYSPQDRYATSESPIRHTVPHRVLKKWLGNEKEIWKRFLIAVEWAEKRAYLAEHGGHHVNELQEDLEDDEVVFYECEYLPQLIVSGCMSDLQRQCLLFIDYLLTRPEHVEVFDATDWRGLSYEDQSCIAFCFASQCLSNSQKHKQLSDRSDMSEVSRYNMEHAKTTDGLTAYAILVDESLSTDFGYRMQMRPLLEQALCFKAVGVIACFAHDIRPPIAFPLLDRLPLVDLGVRPPAPYWDPSLGKDVSWSGWLRRYNAAASQESNLKGEWVGVFSEGLITHPMTENIHFHHRPLPEEFFTHGLFLDRHGALPLSADDCIDPVGHFSLRGQIDVSGTFYFEKSYTRHSQMRWMLRGAMTPFGMVGLWWQHDAPDMGYFWLYKRAWCTPLSETFTDLPTSDIIIDPYPRDMSDEELDDLEREDLDPLPDDLDEEISDIGGSESEEWITEDSHDEESKDGDNNIQEA